jgi:hypothetical protein
MRDYSDVDAAELWQLINTYAQGGHLLEVRNYVVSQDGSDRVPEDRFWPIDREGLHIGGWWPSQQEVDTLISEGLLEPGEWEEKVNPERATRRYTLTPTGRDLASLDENQVLGFFAKKGIREHEHGQTRWC